MKTYKRFNTCRYNSPLCTNSQGFTQFLGASESCRSLPAKQGQCLRSHLLSLDVFIKLQAYSAYRLTAYSTHRWLRRDYCANGRTADYLPTTGCSAQPGQRPVMPRATAACSPQPGQRPRASPAAGTKGCDHTTPALKLEEAAAAALHSNAFGATSPSPRCTPAPNQPERQRASVSL